MLLWKSGALKTSVPYTVKIYNRALSTLRHTITNEAQIQTHKGMNDDLGSFEIVLPAAKAFSSAYTDIVPSDYVKLWVGTSNPASDDPDFMGKIYQSISTAGEPPTPYQRILKGRSLNEILQRRIKSRTSWVATEADDIIAELAADLSLGDTYVATDTTDVTLTIDQENYVDILKKVSDHWYSAGTQVKKDFWVEEVSGTFELIWAPRPRRTVGVETLGSGTNILSYSLTRDLTNLKNAIGVYGNLTPFNITDVAIYGRKNPTDGDSWTYGAYWTATTGTATSGSSTPQIGATYTHLINVSSPYNVAAYCTFPVSVVVEGLNGYGVLEFYGRRHNTGVGVIQLYAPDSSNYFELDNVSFSDSNDVWKFHRYSIGKNNEYSVDSNPDGWTLTGSPSWEQLTALNVICDTAAGAGAYVDIDGLCFNFGRWRYAPAADATSISAYDEFDLVASDTELTDDTMCEKRAKTYLYQYKDPTKRLDITVNGNNNILLGDQIPITISGEGLSSENFYVTGVDHLIADNGWRTTATMIDTVSCRDIPSIAQNDVIIKSIKNLQQISRNKKRIN
jgi:hypothetical protein